MSLHVLFATKTLRTFAYGFLNVLFPFYLASLGWGPRGIGAAVTATLFSIAGATILIRRPAERAGARVVLMTLSGLSVLSALLFLWVPHPTAAVAAAMLGNLAVGTGETGPFLTLEQVVLSRAVPRPALATVMSLYNMTGYVAAALGAASVTMLGGSPARFFWMFLAASALQGALYSRLQDARPAPRPAAPAGASSLVRRLAALFALDAFAGGFIVPGLMVYWFSWRFGLGLEALGQVFFATQFLSGISFLLAPRLSARFGLVGTMVWSHVAANLLLIALAFAPTAPAAVALLLARSLLSQLDVPTRQTFLMLAVGDHEREAAVSVTNTSRTVAQAVSPALTGWIMQSVSMSAPFALGGVLKIAYDLMLWRAVRRVRAD